MSRVMNLDSPWGTNSPAKLTKEAEVYENCSITDEEEVLNDLDEDALAQLPIHLQNNMREIQLERVQRLQEEELRYRRQPICKDYYTEEWIQNMFETISATREMKFTQAVRHREESIHTKTQIQTQPHDTTPIWLDDSESRILLPCEPAKGEEVATMAVENCVESCKVNHTRNDDLWPCGEIASIRGSIIHHGDGEDMLAAKDDGSWCQNYEILAQEPPSEQQGGHVSLHCRKRKSSVLLVMRHHVRKKFRGMERLLKK